MKVVLPGGTGWMRRILSGSPLPAGASAGQEGMGGIQRHTVQWPTRPVSKIAGDRAFDWATIRPMTGRKTTAIPERHSAYAPGKEDWKAAGNRLSGPELSALTSAVAAAVTIRPPQRSILRVRRETL